MENKQIIHSQVDSQGRKLSLPRKLSLLLTQIKCTFPPTLWIALIATHHFQTLLQIMTSSLRSFIQLKKKRKCVHAYYTLGLGLALECNSRWALAQPPGASNFGSQASKQSVMI